MGVVKRLRDLGYIEGQNIAFERRYADGKLEILPVLAAELVRLRPEVVLAIGTPAARAAKSATQTIPIVFARTADPIGSGLVSALARPGGNLTGLSDQMVETGAKRLELLTTAVANVKRVGVLWNSDYPPNSSEVKELEQAAPSLNLQLIPVDVRGRTNLTPRSAHWWSSTPTP
ncbi:MAG: ABC transporter substrate-binding protein [Stellaceae bacterium]